MKSAVHPYNFYSSRIITITSDFGILDEYVGVMKGVILSFNPRVQIVDLNNSIDPGDVIYAQFVLEHSFFYFPDGTVHLCVVDPGVGSERKGLIVKYKNHLFVGPDNGVFSFAFEGCDFVMEIKEDAKQLSPSINISNTFHGRDLFAPVAGYISMGGEIDFVGKKMGNIPVKVRVPSPVEKEGRVVGEILFFDRFGNAITNIRGGAVGMKVRIEGVKREIPFLHSYSMVEKGKPLAVSGSKNYLEVSVNMGSAEKELGLKKGQRVILYY